MNREWAAFFGRGLVRTVEDFGYQGERPSHPELLDWLAVALVENGWSIKAMHRLIVTSATYRQSSRVTPELLAKDRDNRLLARGPRVRLEAEVIRDSVLQASGLLSERIGGPSVFPPQPPGVTTEGTYGGLAWNVSQGADRYRRGLYTFTKRTAPYAMFATFDAPSGEVCVARRDVSNTPLQALTLLERPGLRRGRPGARPDRGRGAGHASRIARDSSSAAASRVRRSPMSWPCSSASTSGSASGSSAKSSTPPGSPVPVGRRRRARPPGRSWPGRSQPRRGHHERLAR